MSLRRFHPSLGAAVAFHRRLRELEVSRRAMAPVIEELFQKWLKEAGRPFVEELSLSGRELCLEWTEPAIEPQADDPTVRDVTQR
jgi:hypothetical protein